MGKKEKLSQETQARPLSFQEPDCPVFCFCGRNDGTEVGGTAWWQM